MLQEKAEGTRKEKCLQDRILLGFASAVVARLLLSGAS